MIMYYCVNFDKKYLDEYHDTILQISGPVNVILNKEQISALPHKVGNLSPYHVIGNKNLYTTDRRIVAIDIPLSKIYFDITVELKSRDTGSTNQYETLDSITQWSLQKYLEDIAFSSSQSYEAQQLAKSALTYAGMLQMDAGSELEIDQWAGKLVMDFQDELYDEIPSHEVEQPTTAVQGLYFNTAQPLFALEFDIEKGIGIVGFYTVPDVDSIVFKINGKVVEPTASTRPYIKLYIKNINAISDVVSFSCSVPDYGSHVCNISAMYLLDKYIKSVSTADVEKQDLCRAAYTYFRCSEDYLSSVY